MSLLKRVARIPVKVRFLNLAFWSIVYGFILAVLFSIVLAGVVIFHFIAKWW